MIKEQIANIEQTIEHYKNQLESMKSNLLKLEVDHAMFNKIDMNKVFAMFPETIEVLQRSAEYIDSRKNYIKQKYDSTIIAIEAKEKTISDYQKRLEMLREEVKDHKNGEYRFQLFFTNESFPADKDVYVKIKKEHDYDGIKYYFVFYTKEGKKHNCIKYTDFGGFSSYQDIRYARYYNKKTKIKLEDYSQQIPDEIVNKKACLKQMRRMLFRDYFNDIQGTNGRLILDPKSYDYEELQGLINLS